MAALSTKDVKDMTVEELNAEVAWWQEKRRKEDEFLLANPPSRRSGELWERQCAVKLDYDLKQIEKLEKDVAGLEMKPAKK